MGTAIAVYPCGVNEWSTARGVVIDGVVYALDGEPPAYPLSVHFGSASS